LPQAAHETATGSVIEDGKPKVVVTLCIFQV
jgi:hypothetical protein